MMSLDNERKRNGSSMIRGAAENFRSSGVGYSDT